MSNPEEDAVIKLSGDTLNNGIAVEESKSFTLDLNDKMLDLEGAMAGSAGTQTNGFQFLKDSDIVIKNGTIKSEDAKILIQNYSNLTLDNVKLIGSPNNTYVLSNNYGNIILKNGTEIRATEGNVAFDLYYGMNKQGAYDNGVTVTIEDPSVIIEGPIEYGKAKRATDEAFLANTHCYIPKGYELSAPSGYKWVDAENGNGMLELRPE